MTAKSERPTEPAPRASALAFGSVVHFVGRGIARLGSFVFLAFLARRLSPSDLGEFAYLMALGLLFQVLVDFGQSTAVTRELATRAPRSSIGSGLIVKIVLATLVLASGALVFRDSSLAAASLLLWFAMLLDSLTLLLLTHARCERRLGVIAVADLVRYWAPLLCFIAGTATVQFAPTIVLAVGCILSGSAFSFGVVIVLEGPRFLQTAWRPSTGLSFVRVGSVLFLINLVLGLNNKLDVIALRLLDSSASVARYAAAYAMVNGLLLIPQAITFVAFPDLARLDRVPPATRLRWYSMLMRSALLSGSVCGVALGIAAGSLLTTLFGTAFEAAKTVLWIMGFGLPFLFVSTVCWSILVSQNAQARILRYLTVGVFLNLCLNLILVPVFSIEGAAVATVLVEVAVCWLAWREVADLPLELRSRWGPAAGLCGGYAIGTFVILRSVLPDAIAASVAGVVLALGVVAAGLVSRQEFKFR